MNEKIENFKSIMKENAKIRNSLRNNTKTAYQLAKEFFKGLSIQVESSQEFDDNDYYSCVLVTNIGKHYIERDICYGNADIERTSELIKVLKKNKGKFPEDQDEGTTEHNLAELCYEVKQSPEDVVFLIEEMSCSEFYEACVDESYRKNVL